MRCDVGRSGGSSATRTLPESPVPRSGIACREAASAAELGRHFDIRHQVFVDEQAVFAGSDLDVHDQRDSVIRLLGYCDGVVAGTVRLFELDPETRLWQGDRLAVLEPFRVRGLGPPLVRCAVAMAGARGGCRMNAHIQLANVAFFVRLGWTAFADPEIYAGLVHQPMTIALPAPREGAAVVRALASWVSAKDL